MKMKLIVLAVLFNLAFVKSVAQKITYKDLRGTWEGQNKKGPVRWKFINDSVIVITDLVDINYPVKYQIIYSLDNSHEVSTLNLFMIIAGKRTGTGILAKISGNKLLLQGKEPDYSKMLSYYDPPKKWNIDKNYHYLAIMTKVMDIE